MVDYGVHFVAYHKIYMFTGAILLFLVILPTKEKMSAKTQKALYLGVVIWVICFGYRIYTGQNITALFENNEALDNESQPVRIAESPFNKYYSNEAGRKPKEGN